MPEIPLPLLRLAFTMHMCEQVLGCDTQVAPQERVWLLETFPPQMLARAGFMHQGRRTAAYEEARDLALLELPEALTEGEKMQLMETLVAAAAADGLLMAEEATAIAHAARLLRLNKDTWSEHLGALLEAGQIERDGCAVD